jgi:GNAT superfamily N-acetyltransferase
MGPDEVTVYFVPVNDSNIPVYIRTGIKSYHEHYTYLWKNEDPTPYLLKNFTSDAVSADLGDTNNMLYIIYSGQEAAGTVKVVKSSVLPGNPRESAMLLDKIYLLREFAGRGIGAMALSHIEVLGRSLGRSVLWLYSMQKGPALSFYLKHGFVIKAEKRLEYPEVRDEHRLMYVLAKSIQTVSGPDDE